jgi:ferric-dicitrate binding protein FerR (iron transport regulator)
VVGCGPQCASRGYRDLCGQEEDPTQRAELKTYIQYSTARSAWEELLRIEAQVRKRKQATDHRKAEIKEMLITVVIVGLVLAAGIAGLALLAYLLWASQQ